MVSFNRPCNTRYNNGSVRWKRLDFILNRRFGTSPFAILGNILISKTRELNSNLCYVIPYESFR